MNAPALAPERQPVEDSSQVRVAVSHATRIARSVGFDAAAVDTIALAATELAENLHRHAVGGQLVVLPPADVRGAFTLVALDRGPGVDRFELCLADGYTTIGTMGVGLGTVRRLASQFDAVSEPGRGTAVAATFDIGLDGRARATPPVAPVGFDVGVIGFPVAPESRNGDDWRVVRRGTRLIVGVADGLGHGPDAALASGAVLAGLASAADLDPAEVLGVLGPAARHTRGAAVTVAVLEGDALLHGGRVDSAGLGNVTLVTVAPDGTTRRAAGTHGTAGHGQTRARTVATPFPAGGALVVHTDGLTSRWDLHGRADLLRHGAVVVAAVLWRDFARDSDDSCVVVVRAAAAR